MIAERTCTKCGEMKPQTVDFFYFDKRDQRFESTCKACRLKRCADRQGCPEVRARRAETEKVRRKRSPEKFAANARRWYERHREQAKATGRKNARKWRSNNPERARQHDLRKEERRRLNAEYEKFISRLSQEGEDQQGSSQS